MTKVKQFTLMAIIIAIASSCSENNVTGPTSVEQGIEALAPALFSEEIETDAIDTKSTWGYADGKYIFTWGEQSSIRVFAMSADGSNDNMQYSIKSGADQTTARFSGNNFGLKQGGTYYAISPYTNSWLRDIESSEKEEDQVWSMTEMPITYEGQIQSANNNSDHMGKYDYLVAAEKVGDGGYAHLAFKRMGAPVRVHMKGLGNRRFKEFQIITSDNYDLRYERKIDLTDAGNSLDRYAPTMMSALEPRNEIGEKYAFSLKLGTTDAVGNWVGIQTNTEVDGGSLDLFLMMPATKELMTKSLYGVLIPDDGSETMYISMNGREFKANTPVAYSKTAFNGQNLNLTISIDRKWQRGNTIGQTRGAEVGDPGIDDTFTKPDHLYIYTCTNNKYWDRKIIKSEDPEWEGWNEVKDSKGNSLNKWNYGAPITIELPASNSDLGDNIHVYVVASVGEIDITTGVLSPLSTLESAVANATLNTTYTQDLLKNLYAYDYKIGVTSDAKIINAVLYHAAAKLDVQWNSDTALSGNVSVNGLPTTGLKLFTPTANDAGTGWSPISPTLNSGNNYNGRYVFYVPQLSTSTYNITVGSTTEYVTFTPDVTSPTASPQPPTTPWTSWLKANITIKQVP